MSTHGGGGRLTCLALTPADTLDANEASPPQGTEFHPHSMTELGENLAEDMLCMGV